MKRARVVLVGIGGYGATYAHEILEHENPSIDLVGAVDPFPEKSRFYPLFQDKNVPIYPSMEEFFAHSPADLAVISTPIFLHTEQILTALSHGADVLCEKPLCADANDIPRLLDAEKKSGKTVHIGYQMSYSDAITSLKADLDSGKFGAPIELKALVLRPRTRDYFARGVGWAGKLKTVDGRLVFDSVANNAAAHYLFNLLHMIPDTPKHLNAELLRANPIENFDTCNITFSLRGVPCQFVATHAVNRLIDTLFLYQFERATVCYSATDPNGVLPDWYTDFGNVVARLESGEMISYGNPLENPCRKLHYAVECTLAETTHPIVCGITETALHTRLINTIQNEFTILPIKPDLIREENNVIFAQGLFEQAIHCFHDPTQSLLHFAE